MAQKDKDVSKTLSIILTSALATTAIVGILSYSLFKKVPQEQSNRIINSNNLPQDQILSSTETDIVNDFIKAKYRTIAILDNPFAPYSLIIATERSKPECGSPEEPSRCTDDSNCGSIYTSPNCYFFIEPHFVAHVDPSTRFVGKWKSGMDGLIIDSILFKDANNIQFESAGGDAGANVEIVWNLNLKTGQILELSKKQSGPND